MKQIIINKCYGGFGLSHAAVMLYAKLSGFKLYPFVEDRKLNGHINFEKYVPYIENKEAPFTIHYNKKPLTKSGKYNERGYFGARDIARDDPILIEVIKKLRKKANASHSNLKIVQIPNDVRWRIEEYDGLEHVAEDHRTW